MSMTARTLKHRPWPMSTQHSASSLRRWEEPVAMAVPSLLLYVQQGQYVELVAHSSEPASGGDLQQSCTS